MRRRMTSRETIGRENRRVSRIRPFLYVAGIAGLTPGVLGRFGTVVNLIPGFRLRAPAKLNVYHIAIEDEEGTDLVPYWTTIFKAIDEERTRRGKLLLLCGMGISRSAAFAIGYLMCIERLTLHDAYKHVQHCRSVVCPNVGFFRQLIELEDKMFHRSTVRMIEPVPGVIVADVVWNELYDEMMESLSEEDRQALRTARMDTASSSSSGGDSREAAEDSLSICTSEVDRLSLRSSTSHFH